LGEGDQPVRRPLPAQDNKNTETNIHALDWAVTVIRSQVYYLTKNVLKFVSCAVHMTVNINIDRSPEIRYCTV
jgi:hypothetical protein